MRIILASLLLVLAMNVAGQQKHLFCHAAIKANTGYQPNSAGLADGYFMWDTGQTLYIKFLNGSTAIQQQVIRIAKTWEQYANIRFKFIDSGDTHIRINLHGEGFLDAPLGTIANIFPQDEVNVQIDTSGFNSTPHATAIVLHTFGHILGLHHENRVPLNGRKWDRYKLLDYFSDHGWDEQQVEDRIISPYSITVSNSILVDRSSVMHISLPTEWVNEEPVALNTSLSEHDKSLVKMIYPPGSHPNLNPAFTVSNFKGFRKEKVLGGFAFYPMFDITMKAHRMVFAVMICDSKGVALPANNNSYIFKDDLATTKALFTSGNQYEINKSTNDFGFFMPSYELPGTLRGQKLKIFFRVLVYDYENDKEVQYDSKPFDFVWD